MSAIPSSVLLMAGIAAVFASSTIALTVIGVTTQERRAVGRSLAALEILSGAPPEMQGELNQSFRERVVQPALARLNSLGRRFTPSDKGARIQHRLDIAGNPTGWTVDRVVGFKFVGFAVMLFVSLVVTMLMALSFVVTLAVCVGLSLVGYVAVSFYIYQLGYDRSEKMQKDLPDALDLLTISVEAGLAFDSALSRVAKSTEGPLTQEFARVLQEMNIGTGRTNAMRALGDRTSVPELKSFVTAMVQAAAFGIPIGTVLRIQSSEMRVKRRQRAEEKAQKVPVKILFPLIFCILPTLFIIVMGPGVITIMQSFSNK
ncbi:MAG: type II secretion system F family protein [Actinobacteria bacterium]|nr:type II secretion system F family protein [Actinomycetota bacterium]